MVERGSNPNYLFGAGGGGRRWLDQQTPLGGHCQGIRCHLSLVLWRRGHHSSESTV